MVKDFITFLDYTPAEITALVDLAGAFHQSWHAQRTSQALQGKSIACIWDAEGFRNRAAFELGIARMGGTFVQIPGKLDERESIEDVTRYLDNWFDGIVARTRSHSHIQRLAQASRRPVINARTDFNHPCEILGDLAYIRARRGSLEKLKVIFVGEATNLCHAWLEAAARLPIQVVQICPQEYWVNAEFLAGLQREALGTLEVSEDLGAGLKQADVVYTDCWPKRNTPQERARVASRFTPYQITLEKLILASSEVLFLPCPPVTRGEEVSADAMDFLGAQVYAAKEYLLHAQNAVLTTLIHTEG